MSAELLDQLTLVQLRIAVQIEFLGTFLQLVDCPLLVRRGLSAGLGDIRPPSIGGRIGDSGRLLLGIALLA